MEQNTEPTINPCIYGQLIQWGEEYTIGERTVALMNGVGKSGQARAKK